MKKLGLRAVAGGLAVLMAVAGFAPATANAADVLTAKASKTLVITADMVDDDGEIVISNENWDRIIVEKEVNAKDIYFDGVEVGELVVESGGESNIQLWEVAAEQVTVKEPGLVELDINEIRALYADKETKAQAFELYMATRAANKNTLTKVPSIVTMEDAVVESLSVSGSVELNVAQGAVKAVTLEANAKVSQMDVTLNGYDGDVTYKGTEGFSVINLNSVNCAIENLKVEGTATNNYLNVESKNSTSANVEVAGNAGLSLNIPVAKLDVVAGATAAQVSVLSTVDELNVAASNASVNVGADAKVAAATIVGDKVSMSGEGKLTKVDITGKDASVSTSGTGIKGENTYRPPVVKEPEKPAVEFGTLPEGSLVFLPSETNMTGYGYTKEDMENGAVAVTINGQYQEIQFNLPKNVDLSLYDKLVVTLESPDDSTANALCLKVIATDAELDTYNNPNPFLQAWGVVKYPGGDVQLDLSNFEDKDVCRFTVMANNGACAVNVYRIAFIPKAGVTPPAGDDTPEEPVTPAAPSELPENYAEFKFADLEQASEGDWGNTKEAAGFHDGVKISYAQQYAAAKFVLPEAVEVSEYDKMIVTMSSAANGIMFVIFDDEGNELGVWYGRKSEATADIEIALTSDEFWQGSREIPQDGNIKYIALSANDEGESSTVAYRVAFVPRENSGSDPVLPEVTVTIAEVENAALTLDDTLTLSAVASGSDSAVTWSSSDETVATVDENGVVTPVAAGTVTITAACGDATDTVDLTVEKAFYLKGWDSSVNKWVVNSKDVAFNVTTAEMWGNIIAPLQGHYGLGEYLDDMLPASLAGTDLSTVDAIKTNVDKFVFTTVVTKCTSETATLQGVVQAGETYGYAGTYSETKSIGAASEAAPAVVTTEVSMTAAANLQEIAQTCAQFVDTVAGTEITGTYTIKIVLK